MRHYENLPMQYTEIFFELQKLKKFIGKSLMFSIFLLKTLIVNHLAEAVLTSTHNVSFVAKIRKIVYPCKLQFYCLKVGFEGVYI